MSPRIFVACVRPTSTARWALPMNGSAGGMPSGDDSSGVVATADPSITGVWTSQTHDLYDTLFRMNVASGRRRCSNRPVRLLVPAFVLALVLVMLAAPADADVGENALSAAAAGTVTRVDLEDDEVDWGVGGMLAGIYERGITLSVWLRAAVHVSFEHSIDGETRPGAAATLGASYPLGRPRMGAPGERRPRRSRGVGDRHRRHCRSGPVHRPFDEPRAQLGSVARRSRARGMTTLSRPSGSAFAPPGEAVTSEFLGAPCLLPPPLHGTLPRCTGSRVLFRAIL